MPKSISASLQTDIRNNVTTLTTCVVITRKDGKPYRITTHDEDVVFEGNTYRHDVPLMLPAIDSGSQMAIDNTELTLFADGNVFTRQEFADGLFDHAEVEIFQIDYDNPTHGRMTMRRGWFGKVIRNENDHINVTVTGLLKILDFETGRFYQPTCDADLGDTRCKVAIRQEQIRSPYNSYGVGEWVYHYDPTLMNAFTLTNPSFDTSNVAENASIPGWTKGTGAGLFVAATASSPTYGDIGDLDPADGTRALYGSDEATADSSGFESFLYQDIDLLAAGLSAGAIDDGQISIAYFALLGTTVYTLDPVRLRVEITDESGEFVGNFDTRYMFMPTAERWYERAIVAPLYPNARFVRIYIYFRKEDGVVANCAADDVRVYWWNHTTTSPYDDVTHRCTRLVQFNDNDAYRPPNYSFEAQNNVTNANNPTITDWTTSGWWQIDNQVGSGGYELSVEDGSYFLSGGDDGTGTQRTNTITQTFTVATVGLDTSRLLLQKYIGKISVAVGFGGVHPSTDTGTATVTLEMLNAANVVLDTVTLFNDENYGTGVFGVWQTRGEAFTVPALTSSFRVTLTSKSPTGSGRALVGFDGVKFWFYDAEHPVFGDLITAQPQAATVMDTTEGSFTVDGYLIWKAMTIYSKYDQVSAVTDRKTFNGTTITGAAGSYETGTIWWISGRNAGLKNVIRTWTSGTKTLKMYFRQPYPIEVGDRFIYVRSCQRRFAEDCQTVFQNQVNFRGFPHLPGKLRDATTEENDAG